MDRLQVPDEQKVLIVVYEQSVTADYGPWSALSSQLQSLSLTSSERATIAANLVSVGVNLEISFTEIVPNIVKSIPDIIKAASASPLGIFALIIIVVGGLAYVYFKSAPMRIRVGIFASLFLGAVLYGVAITKAANSSSPDDRDSQQSSLSQITSIDGVVADASTGQSIDRATITTVSNSSPVVTDTNGIFHMKIKNPKAGRFGRPPHL